MKTAKQTQREARRLFHLCLSNGSVDDQRARDVVRQIVEARRHGSLALLSRFQRLVRIDRAQHTADVKSAVPLPLDVRARFETIVRNVWGPGVTVTFGTDPALLGGVRITVGSDVFDGSVSGGLAALEARF